MKGVSVITFTVLQNTTCSLDSMKAYTECTIDMYIVHYTLLYNVHAALSKEVKLVKKKYFTLSVTMPMSAPSVHLSYLT